MRAVFQYRVRWGCKSTSCNSCRTVRGLMAGTMPVVTACRASSPLVQWVRCKPCAIGSKQASWTSWARCRGGKALGDGRCGGHRPRFAVTHPVHNADRRARRWSDHKPGGRLRAEWARPLPPPTRSARAARETTASTGFAPPPARQCDPRKRWLGNAEDGHAWSDSQASGRLPPLYPQSQYVAGLHARATRIYGSNTVIRFHSLR
jgi:hypothetical protein